MPIDAVPVDPATLSLDLSDESATTALFRAAIGPVGAHHYLPVFARFDLADRAGSGWNWVACLCTLSWMVFRRLWGAALLYVGVLVGVVLLAAALVGLVLEVPEQVQWGIGLALLLAACVVPGAWGDAWLYDHCRTRMARALAASTSWSDAVALLDREALTPSRAWWLALVYLVVLGALAGVVWALPESQLPASSPVPGTDAPRVPAQAASTPVLAGSAAVGAASAAAVTVPLAPASASASASASAAASVSHAVPAPAPSPASAPAPAPASVPLPASLAAPASAARSATSIPAPIALSAALRAGPPATTASAPAVPARAARVPAPTVSTPAPSKAAAPVSAEESGQRYIVNIGLFAVDANARKAAAALRGAGVKLLVQELQTSSGTRTRVRAGPYESLAEAGAAADTVRALGLEAQVVRQPAQADR